MNDKQREALREIEKDSEPSLEENDLLKRQKATYEREPGKWVIYFSSESCPWQETVAFNCHDAFNPGTEVYQIVDIKDKKIADAVIANPNVEVEYFVTSLAENFWNKLNQSFFKFYNPDTQYRLAPTETKPTSANTAQVEINSMEDLNNLAIKGEEKVSMLGGGNCRWCNRYLSNSMKLSNHETMCLEESNAVAKQKEHFAKFGFEAPEFECELLKEIEGYIIGYIKDDVGLAPIPMAWSIETGYCYTNPDDDMEDTDYNLTPIKPKEEIKFPKLMFDERYEKLRIVYSKDDIGGHYRQATKEEHTSLYYEGK